MASGVLSPIGFLIQAFTNAGVVLAGGKIFTYTAGTTNLVTSYTDSTLVIANANPIILDSSGRQPQSIWFPAGTLHKMVLQDANGVVIKTIDNLVSINDYVITSTVANVTAARALTASTTAPFIFISGLDGGLFRRDPTDTTSAEDGGGFSGTVIRSLDYATNGVWKRVYSGALDVRWFGAKGDGVNDDRLSIQNAITAAAAITGSKVVSFSNGRFLLGANGGVQAQIEIGSPTAGGTGVNNLTLVGFNAEIWQGSFNGPNGYKVIGINNSTNIRITGLRIVGYTGGIIGVARQNDALITVNYNSIGVTVDHCYLTNSLGDCIYAGGSWDAGGGTGFYTTNLHVYENTLKMRFGNGTPSYSGGTQSRTAMALIDVWGANIHDNTIYGVIDEEPNLNGQNLVDINIHHNQFRDGNVTAQSVIGTNYNFDEPLNTSGGSIMPQQIIANGVAGSPTVSGNVVDSNTFDTGNITSYGPYAFTRTSGNSFTKGAIYIGSTSGANYTSNMEVSGNVAQGPLTGNTFFIQLKGFIALCVIRDNTAAVAGGYVVQDQGGSTGDFGRNTFANNTNNSSTSSGSLSITAPQLTSSFVNNLAVQSTVAWPSTTRTQVTSTWSPMVTVPNITGANLNINWNSNQGNFWFTSQTAVDTPSINTISNPPGDGFLLSIMSGASGGGGTLTLVHGTGNLFLKGAANAVMTGNQILTLRSRAGNWYEESRGF